MSKQKDPITEADLHAYVDGLLSEERRAEVDAFLSTHPDEAERLRLYQGQNQALRAMFNPILEKPIPPELMAARKPRRFPTMRHAALIGCFAVGVFVGWRLRGMETSGSTEARVLVKEAALAHLVYTPEVKHSVEVWADQEEHLVQWLSKRLGTPLKAPHLAHLGYRLVGGRLLPGSGGAVAQFMYQNEKGKRLTLYLRPGNGKHREIAFHFAQEGTVTVLYWFGDKLSCALSGEVDKAELSKVADAIYRDLNPYIYD